MSDTPLTPSEKSELIDELLEQAVQRPDISTESREEFEAARADGDMQAQIDVIWHILSGTDPAA